MSRVLRPYQRQAVTAWWKDVERGKNRSAVVLPTGTGKTDVGGGVAVPFAREHGPGSVLALALRGELLDQMTKRFAQHDPTLPVGRWQAERTDAGRFITCGSVQTLQNAKSRDRYERVNGKPSLIVYDECFPAGTLVGDVPIESIRTGDYVDSWDETAGRPVRRRVAATMRSRPSSLVKVQTDRGDVICTPGHPFLTLDGWVTAGMLPRDASVLQAGHSAPDDEGVCRGGRRFAFLAPGVGRPTRRTVALARVAGVQVLEPGRDGTYGGLCPRGVVYNLEVEGTHTYRVGAAGLVAHNCHHAVSPGSMAILGWGGAFAGVPTLGLTATMVRGDRIGLGDAWQSVAYQRDIGWAITQGYLVPPRGKVVVIDALDLEHAKIDRTKGDYAEGELGSMIEQGVDEIVASWLRHASDRITAAFVPTVEAAYALAAEYVGRGVSAEVVVGNTKRPERDAIYGRLARGETRVLVGVMVTTEGWDCPPVSCILQARPTRLPGLYQQIVGRGLRPDPDNAGKVDCLVLDVVGASRYQRLVSLVDLHPTAEIDTSELDALPCEECGATPCQCEQLDDEAEGAAPEPEKPRLLGPATYEDVDLFAGSGCVWLFTHGGTRFLPAGDRMAIIWQHPVTGSYRVGSCLSGPRFGFDGSIDRDGQWFRLPGGSVDGWELDTARMAAESWALNYAPTIANRTAPWKRKAAPPTRVQVGLARQLGIVGADTMNRARLSDEISIASASLVLDRG